MQKKARSSASLLLQQVRNRTPTLHMSIRTEDNHCQWIEKFLRYHKNQAAVWRHPNELGSPEINQFITWLAVDKQGIRTSGSDLKSCADDPHQRDGMSDRRAQRAHKKSRRRRLTAAHASTTALCVNASELYSLLVNDAMGI
jgi:hypothetical protein